MAVPVSRFANVNAIHLRAHARSILGVGVNAIERKQFHFFPFPHDRAQHDRHDKADPRPKGKLQGARRGKQSILRIFLRASFHSIRRVVLFVFLNLTLNRSGQINTGAIAKLDEIDEHVSCFIAYFLAI